MLKKEETKKAVSSIKSKLSAPKVAGSSLEDKRKQKHGTFSASLSREQILASQARHEEKMRALGKPVPGTPFENYYKGAPGSEPVVWEIPTLPGCDGPIGYDMPPTPEDDE